MITNLFMMLSIKSACSLAYLVLLLLWNVGAASAAATGDGSNQTAAPTYTSVHIGLILDSASHMDAMVDSCISMAISDFYIAHPDYQTRLIRHRKDAQEELEVASAAIELMKNEEVHSILGPQMFTQNKFVAELGGKAHVPVVSFTARSQSVSYQQSPYVVRTTPDDSNQARALSSICKGFGWLAAVILYEDSDYGSQFLGKLTKVFQDDEIQLAYTAPISTAAEDRHIMKELKKLVTLQTRVFLVHMNANLGSRLFRLAKVAGMISEGYAWLITDSIGSFMSSVDDASDSMEGVIGLRPYVPKSQNLDNFRVRWKKNMLLMNPDSAKNPAAELNVYGLWAYDTVWALAMAAEKIRPVNPSFFKANDENKNGSDISNLGHSQLGPKLLNELQNISLEGLAGEFRMINGQLATSALEIFNVFETGERPIGYWTPDRGIMRTLSAKGKPTYSTSTNELKSILWPGDSTKKPKGWAIPPTGILKIGVPKKYGFMEFVNVSNDPQTNKTKVTGFSIAIFCSVLQQLPFQIDYEFIPFVNKSEFSNGSYNDLLYGIPNKTFDMVVGDTTILADRAKYVDFTLPYSETGTVMVVKNRKGRDIWIFVKPFRWDLWLLIFSTCIFISIVLRILEHRANSSLDASVPKRRKLGLSFPIASLAFPERDLMANKWSRFVMVIWLLMSFIVMQSYTANLSAMLTVDQLDFRFSNDDYIGVQMDTFVKDFVIKRLNIAPSRIREYGTIEDYHDAMTKGSRNGGIDAIFDEIPYMKLFLDRYSSEYKIVGPSYRTDGFGFVSSLFL
ncbi:OLC1v1035386C1 [Oldenlandia corymbosa var. corymbosa]|uniref:Glutamate receptor n=1 Tax=Oldenlandia corymbosa var. corymbosa TaxID=529605 RepID=A0AAV1CVE1_OLDCO|nr:OLC1v1035386C1 [Oldenlandia corymbosa var. corymbosa]